MTNQSEALKTPGATADLNQWLEYISKVHDKPMELGLERMKAMIERMGIEFACPVITVAGTNGKGSTCAMIDSILRHAGYHTGLHTSPHLIRFNERVVIDGKEVDDERIIEAFNEVERARGDMTLTYFEFTGLAILRIFQKAHLDAVVLEIGLGGRLDAMNAVEPSCSVVCSIDIDHTAYLGSTREEIGLEKACIYRMGKPAVCTDPNPPKSLQEHAHVLFAPLHVYGRDFHTYKHHGLFDFEIQMYRPTPEVVDWRNLPMPSISGAASLQNAAGALAALALLNAELPITRSAVVEGLESVNIKARYEMVKQADQNGASVIVDVAHNPQAARVLAANLTADGDPNVETWAVFGMLRDKNMEEVSRTLMRHIDRWFVTGLPGVRGASLEELRAAMKQAGVDETKIADFASVDEALRAALELSKHEEPGAVRIIAFGSFVTAAAAIESLRHDVREGAVVR